MAGNKNSGNHNPIPAPKDNERALTHGGARALEALSKGKPYKGLVAELELDIQALYEAHGRLLMLERLAIRTHTVAEVFWGAFIKAVDSGEFDKVDHCAKRYGWLSGAAGRLWAQVREEKRLHTTDVSYDELVQRLVDADMAQPMPEVDDDANVQNDAENV